MAIQDAASAANASAATGRVSRSRAWRSRTRPFLFLPDAKDGPSERIGQQRIEDPRKGNERAVPGRDLTSPGKLLAKEKAVSERSQKPHAVERAHPDELQTRGGDGPERLGGIPPEMPDRPVERAVEPLPRGNEHDEGSSGREPGGGLAELALVVLDMFQNVYI